MKKKNDWKIHFFDNLLKAITFLILLPFKKKRGTEYRNTPVKINTNVLHHQWQDIESLIKLGGPSRLKQALIESDKLLDLALKNLMVGGNTMGERLKNAQNNFDWVTYQSLWSAHKLRNEIVHENNREILAPEISSAIENIKNGLRELNIL
ncbi:MAG: hypothetical protein M1338_00795 [Patescibacteria group bacterium]|nr:hypothetical protein [Patescibacteria group bacterium]